MTPDNSDEKKGQPSLGRAALLGLCPQCGDRSLYAGIAEFAPRCRKCSLDFSKFNVGDGPAAFLTLIIGTLIVCLALWVEFTWFPPFWVHAILWVPITAAAVLAGLRGAKAALLYAEYSRNAGEAGRNEVEPREVEPREVEPREVETNKADPKE